MVVKKIFLKMNSFNNNAKIDQNERKNLFKKLKLFKFYQKITYKTR